VCGGLRGVGRALAPEARAVNEATRAAIGRALGAAVVACERCGGGDINDAFQLKLADGRRVFVKTNARAAPTLFATEARGLAWLAEARALALPALLGVGTGEEGAAPFLLLEWIDSGSPAHDFDERLGRGLAELHRVSAPAYGLDHDNFIALLPQDNRMAPSWATFYRERRLAPLFERARTQGLSDISLDRMAEKLLPRLERLVGPPEPPARLHGDLWGGNLLVGTQGQPLLIDPAAYAGHREIDLGMMRLFGGFDERVFEAYREIAPLSPGYRERVALCQLYPLLVHLCMFGAGYLGQVKACVQRYL
jgi:fructosamine-3-kinase